jgi:hypothetical protein
VQHAAPELQHTALVPLLQQVWPLPQQVPLQQDGLEAQQ